MDGKFIIETMWSSGSMVENSSENCQGHQESLRFSMWIKRIYKDEASEIEMASLLLIESPVGQHHSEPILNVSIFPQ